MHRCNDRCWRECVLQDIIVHLYIRIPLKHRARGPYGRFLPESILSTNLMVRDAEITTLLVTFNKKKKKKSGKYRHNKSEYEKLNSRPSTNVSRTSHVTLRLHRLVRLATLISLELLTTNLLFKSDRLGSSIAICRRSFCQHVSAAVTRVEPSGPRAPETELRTPYFPFWMRS